MKNTLRQVLTNQAKTGSGSSDGTPLEITRNSSGYPIINAGGKETSTRS